VRLVLRRSRRRARGRERTATTGANLSRSPSKGVSQSRMSLGGAPKDGGSGSSRISPAIRSSTIWR
jgi:hypothetical protein